ncbi:hypothetical protein TRIUR3_23312 [Triticum urartu]|uniref:Uncharacterized protein n=1 Tax=Triticum urartu TaxID=4572 RepID=M7Z899_TRIUA|nr:hypothetical protein TRIUR3_23312 [Triticum urartu]
MVASRLPSLCSMAWPRCLLHADAARDWEGTLLHLPSHERCRCRSNWVSRHLHITKGRRTATGMEPRRRRRPPVTEGSSRRGLPEKEDLLAVRVAQADDAGAVRLNVPVSVKRKHGTE